MSDKKRKNPGFAVNLFTAEGLDRKLNFTEGHVQGKNEWEELENGKGTMTVALEKNSKELVQRRQSDKKPKQKTGAERD